MIHIRQSADRGHADHGWLKSKHSFSFANYYDPAHMGWGNLRVINEDRIAPGTGFGSHGHRDMEIVSYVMSGELSHKDSMGNEQVIAPGEVQRMTAGTGVVHSEHNHAPGQTTHFLQIWLLPSQQGQAPGYEQKHFPDAQKHNQLRLVASPDGAEGSVHLNADARIYATLMDGSAPLSLNLPAGRKGYVFVVAGSVQLNGYALSAGDAALLEQEPQLTLDQARNAELLVFDLQG
ncbi:pirin family protein [Comamonas sp. GB3 AK4-5]|uniref:pirin family protein n=1 Tax=Comamonas sp. GB3 AK4-5 TaxID=3231487 RepID=UPI00351E6A5C